MAKYYRLGLKPKLPIIKFYPIASWLPQLLPLVLLSDNWIVLVTIKCNCIFIFDWKAHCVSGKTISLCGCAITLSVTMRTWALKSASPVKERKDSFKKLKIDGNERQLRLRVCCTLLTHNLRLCVGGRQFSCALLFFFSFCKMLNISKKRVHATDVQMCWPLTLKNSSWAAYWAKLTKWQWHRQLLRQIETE